MRSSRRLSQPRTVKVMICSTQRLTINATQGFLRKEYGVSWEDMPQVPEAQDRRRLPLIPLPRGPMVRILGSCCRSEIHRRLRSLLCPLEAQVRGIVHPPHPPLYLRRLLLPLLSRHLVPGLSAKLSEKLFLALIKCGAVTQAPLNMSQPRQLDKVTVPHSQIADLTRCTQAHLHFRRSDIHHHRLPHAYRLAHLFRLSCFLNRHPHGDYLPHTHLLRRTV